MTIAPLPVLPARAGASGVSGVSTGDGAGASGEGFAALVLAVLHAGAPGGGPGIGLGIGPAVGLEPGRGEPAGDAGEAARAGLPSTSDGVEAFTDPAQVDLGPADTATLPAGPVALDTAAVHDGSTTTVAHAVPLAPATADLGAVDQGAVDQGAVDQGAVDPRATGPAAVVPGAPVGTATPATEVDAARTLPAETAAAQDSTIDVLPVTLPAALAAALGMTPPTATTGSPAPSSPVGGDPSTVATTVAVDHAPPTHTSPTGPTPTTGGDPSTVATTVAVDHSPPPADTRTPGTPASPTGTTSDVPPSASDPTPAGRHADETSPDAMRMTSRPATAGPATAGADARPATDGPSPTFVQATAGVEAPHRTLDPAPTVHVTRSAAAQVVPELTRLVQAGPGTHRMVLRLDPEHLGEVRITLTVGPEGVRVRMAAGSEGARAALADGLPALHRALETAAGRPPGDTHVTVLTQAQQGQQATTQTTPQASSSAYDGTDASTQQQTGDARPDGQAAPDHQTPADRQHAGDRDAGRPARTQVDTTARDGSQGGGTGRPPRPADPPTSSRTMRLDVSM